MNTKTKVLATTLALGLGIGSASVSASGVPVFDVAGLAQMITDAAASASQFQQQMTQMRQAYNTAMAHKSLVEDLEKGNFKEVFLDVLSDPDASAYLGLSEWSDIYKDLGSVDKLKREFGFWDKEFENADEERKIEMALFAYAFVEKTYQKSVERQKRVQKLSKQYAKADTPAKKSDLQSAIQYEQIQLENDKAMIERMDVLMARKNDLEQRRISYENRQALMAKDW